MQCPSKNGIKVVDLVKDPGALGGLTTSKMKNEGGEKYDADLEQVAKILTNANYRGNVVLEYEEENPFKNVPAAMEQLRKLFGH